MGHLAFEKFVGGTSLTLGLIMFASNYANAAESALTPPPNNPTITETTLESALERSSPGQAQSGSLMFKAGVAGEYLKAPMVATNVEIDISGPIVRSRLSQTFENTTDHWVEGIYVFPLPENAAVDHLRMVIGGRIIDGKIKEKNEAKKNYETAKAQGKKASLVEQERPNMFTASVANIGPHEKIAIQIEYQDKTRINSGEFSVRFPMTVAPRYSPKAQTVQIASTGETVTMAVLDPVLDRARISPPVMDPADEPTNDAGAFIRLPVSININLNAGFPLDQITSPYHEIEIEKIDATNVRIHLKDGVVPANKDFKLEWRSIPSTEPYSAVFRQDIGADTYLLSMLTPPTIQTTKETHARESIFVIDTSGSMGGKSILQAKKSLQLAMDHLDTSDTFNIIRFSDTHSSLFTEPRLANAANLRKARSFINRLEANGGTEMFPALETALGNQTANDKESETSRLRQVMFITDGSIGNEKQLFALLKDKLNNSRLFPVGIGSAPNSYFMSRAAKFGRGTYVQIGDINEVNTRMGDLFVALDNPVLTDLSSNIESGEAYPGNFPDLYQGEPVMMVAKLPTKDLPSQIEFQGRLASTDWDAAQSMEDTMTSKGLDVLWARGKIADLEESRFDRNGAAHIDKQILKTALEHHLVSRLTSLVAVDITPSRPTGKVLNTRPIATMLPDGWDFAKLAYNGAATVQKPASPNPQTGQSSPSRPLPGTASPHVFLGLLGLLFSMFGFLGLKGKRRPGYAKL